MGPQNAERARRSGRRIGNNLDVQFAGARAVEFRIENGLPAAAQKAASLDPDSLARADERGLDVRIRIAFGMLVVTRWGDQSVQYSFDIARDIRVVAFVDEDAGGRVRDVKGANSIAAAGVAHRLLNFGGN